MDRFFFLTGFDNGDIPKLITISKKYHLVIDIKMVYSRTGIFYSALVGGNITSHVLHFRPGITITYIFFLQEDYKDIDMITFTHMLLIKELIFKRAGTEDKAKVLSSV